jgi:acetyl-CoA acetyltransferase
VLARLREVVEAHGVSASAVGDIVIGTVLPRGSTGATQVRVASLLAGFPEEVPCTTVNRQVRH